MTEQPGPSRRSPAFRRFKDGLTGGLGLSPDAVLAFLGLTCFLATCLIAGKPLTWAWALLPGLCLALLIEAAEIVDHYGLRGFFALGTAGVADVLFRHGRDVLVANLAPLLVFGAASWLG